MIDVLFAPTGMEDAPRLSLDVNVSLTVAVWKRIPDCRWMENLVYNIYICIYGHSHTSCLYLSVSLKILISTLGAIFS